MLSDWGTDIYGSDYFIKVSANSNKPMMVFNSFDEDDIKPVKLSEIWDDDIYYVQNVVERAIDFSYNIKVAENDKVVGEIDCSDISKPWNSDYIFSLDGKKIYMFVKPEIDGNYNVYEIENNFSNLSKPELYDTEVIRSNSIFKNGDFYYIKSSDKGESFELYKNKENLGEKSLHEIDAENNEFLMFERVEGTETISFNAIYNNGVESIAVSENGVWGVDVMENGNIMYFEDYNLKSDEGKLYVRTPSGEKILLSEKASRYDLIDIRWNQKDFLEM